MVILKVIFCFLICVPFAALALYLVRKMNQDARHK